MVLRSSNPNKTPEIILKLSNLLDYILYQVQKPEVSLKEELLHIQEYIDLERIRFQDTLDVELTTEGIQESIQIPPMLLMPFVENAFKHGSIIQGKLKIKIEIIVIENNLKFTIINSFRNDHEHENSGGIGLENIQKRLKLLYGDQYNLNVLQQNETYEVMLNLENLQPI